MTAYRIRVAVEPPYDVLVGRGLLDEVEAWLPPTGAARRAAVVTTAAVGQRYGEAIARGLRAAGLAVSVREVPDGEPAKALAVLGDLYDWLASIPLGRDDLVVALGGGVVTDLGGFLAATWHRGVAVVQVPTTLLAQVDAAIGGKTGINLAAGKNLVGAFHQPRVVAADISTLGTLPPRELQAGMAEAVKCGFIRDPVILELIERDPAPAMDPDGDVLVDLVRRAVAVKARVVAADTHEQGERAVLNYGHTFGHALETMTGYTRYRHGEAVGIGMRFAALVGEQIGVSEPGLDRRTVGVLDRIGLPTQCGPVDHDEALAVMARDKKARDGIRLVLCTRPGETMIAAAPPRAVLARALDAIAAPPSD